MAKDRLDNRKEIELAEGISIHLSPAGLAPRLLARLVDYTLLYLALAIVTIPLNILGAVSGAEFIQGVTMILNFLALWFYDPLWELAKTPATPGKRLLKLRVIKRSGTPVGFPQAFMRALLLPIDMLPMGLTGMVSIVSSRHSQRLGDLAAGTMVVYQHEDKDTTPTPIPVPSIRPQSALTREDQIAFVELGRRYPKLSPERQDEIVQCLESLVGTRAPDSRSYALGIARHLSQNEA